MSEYENVVSFSDETDPQAVKPSGGSGSSSLIDEATHTTNENRLEVQPIQISQLPSSKTKSNYICTFVAQCENCKKYRRIPSKHKYEEIRETLLENSFFCYLASEWEPNMSCDLPEDVPPTDDETGCIVWAIDKPNIPRTPIGWERLVKPRDTASARFVDIYYVAPSGKKLQSIKEIEKYLNDHPEDLREGLELSQFSFQVPTPLHKDYLRKCTSRKRPGKLMESSSTKVKCPREV